MFIQSRMVSSESHNTRTSSVPSAKRTLRWMGRLKSFKVILIGISRNPERIVVIMYNIVDIISEISEKIASGKLQIRRF